MNLASEIPLASAVCAGALAAGSLLRRRHGVADFAFAAGMIGLSAEGVFAWMAVRPHVPDAELIAWQKWSLFATAILPFCWLLFSLSCARGNARQFVSKWQLALARSEERRVGKSVDLGGRRI